MGNITHSFVSTLPDGANPALVDKTPWNAPHVIDATGVLVSDGVDAITGVSTNVQGRLLRAAYGNGAITYQFANAPYFLVPDFNFAAIAPTTSLTAGASTIISIPTTVLGINPLSAGLHILRIVDNNPALNEIVLLVSGTTYGTLVFTPANNHVAGQYTITSATAGIQECIAHASVIGGGLCFMPAGTYRVYANTSLALASGISLKLYGVSPAWSMIERDASYPAGNILTYNGVGRGNGSLVLEDFRILGANGFHNTSGYGVGIADVDNSNLFLSRVLIFDGNGGFFLNNAPNVYMQFCRYIESAQQVLANYAAAEAGIRFQGVMSDVNLVGCAFQTQYRGAQLNMLQVGVYINGADGIQFVNCVSNGFYGIRIFPSPTVAIINIWFVNHVCDECREYGVILEGTATNLYTNIYFIRCHFNMQITYAGEFGIAVTGNCDFVYFLQCNSNLGATLGAFFNTSATAWHGGPVQCIWMEGSDSSANGLALRANTAGISIAANSTGVHIRNVIVSKRPNLTSVLTYCLVFSGAASNCSVVGCSFQDYLTGAMFVGGTLTNCLIDANHGLDNIVPTVASAATLACPVNPNFKISGTTGVTAVTGMWAGRKGQLVTTGGAVTFTAGASIANTITTTQNRPINYFFDGTLLYLG